MERFQSKPYLEKGEKHQLAKSLNTSELRIEKWFNNRRSQRRKAGLLTKGEECLTKKYKWISVSTFLPAYKQTCIYASYRILPDIHSCSHAHTHTQTYTHKPTHTHTHTYTHIHTHTYPHTYTHTWRQACMHTNTHIVHELNLKQLFVVWYMRFALNVIKNENKLIKHAHNTTSKYSYVYMLHVCMLTFPTQLTLTFCIKEIPSRMLIIASALRLNVQSCLPELVKKLHSRNIYWVNFEE